VDVREFMSTLPATLHGAGLTLAPATLEVGDYVLTPSLVVERKAIPDLRASLASGRLLTQARAMVKHYPAAALLIEFDGDKPFSLAPPPDPASAPDAAAHTLPARIALLVTHVPRLRLLWSRSSHDAARLFRSLKAGGSAGEPSADAAAAVGLPPDAGDGAVGPPPSSSRENAAAVDVLRRLPGVTDGNWRAVAAAAGSLAGLAALPQADLAAALGGEVAARRLKAFLDHPCPSV
jgi:DNA excision repair protein ERCC-4